MYLRCCITACVVLAATWVHAGCYFGCDSIRRNLSTDYGKIVHSFENKDFLTKKSFASGQIMCHINDKHELEILSVEKNTELHALIAIVNKYAPPDTVGSSDWKAMDISSWSGIQLMNLLNFGVLGIKNGLSEDMRCKGGIWRLKDHVDRLAIICVYDEDADLPLTDSQAKAVYISSGSTLEISPEKCN